jgi:hypothetical protein
VRFGEPQAGDAVRPDSLPDAVGFAMPAKGLSAVDEFGEGGSLKTGCADQSHEGRPIRRINLGLRGVPCAQGKISTLVVLDSILIVAMSRCPAGPTVAPLSVAFESMMSSRLDELWLAGIRL